MNKWELSRRQLLRDLGVGAAMIPLLRASQAGAATQKNLMIIQATEGYRHANWKPADGPLGTLPKSCVPLDAHKADLVFLSMMGNKGFAGCGACGHGAYGTTYYGLPPKGGTGEYAEPNGPTVDQVIAKATAGGSARPSFHAAVEIQLPPSLGGPGHNHCFWAGAGQPMNYELDVAKTYSDVFGGMPAAPAGGAVDATAAKRLLARRQSILDYVGNSLTKFGKRLGTDDRQLIDGHSMSIRQLELQISAITNSPAAGGGKCGGDPGGAIDQANQANYEKIYDAYAAIMVAMLKCGVTHITTLQLGDATGDSINFGAFVPGIPPRGTGYKTPYRNWHDLGHNPVLGGVDHKQIVDQWWMGKFSKLLDQMKAVPDVGGTGTLLDNSVVIWGNHMHEGSDHGAQAVPWILAGKCGGYFKTGQALSGNNTAMVMADICNAMGVSQHPFGGGYPGLKA